MRLLFWIYVVAYIGYMIGDLISISDIESAGALGICMAAHTLNMMLLIMSYREDKDNWFMRHYIKNILWADREMVLGCAYPAFTYFKVLAIPSIIIGYIMVIIYLEHINLIMVILELVTILVPIIEYDIWLTFPVDDRIKYKQELMNGIAIFHNQIFSPAEAEGHPNNIEIQVQA